MKEKFKKITFRLFTFFLLLCSSLIVFHTEVLSAAEIDPSVFIKKVSKSYTKKFCNAIGFGLSKESAMNFSLEENKQVFKKKKEINNINKELLAEEIAISVVEKCGYPINLLGEKGITEFKNYYLSKDQESLKKQN
ncbi:putative ATP synthase protein 8 precursor [Prochlorococcus sp. MIT 0801]|nr:putative ATP synthase protein 8 precursor [Prochlorococcus sp. MIT 0801]